MAAINVTSADSNTNRINAGTRQAVRTSAGIPYVVVHHATANDIRVYKGNSTTPTSFTGQDTSNEPTLSVVNIGTVAAAIDSSDIIHILSYTQSGKNSVLRYNVFDTSSDTWTSTNVSAADVGDDAPSSPYLSIAIDSNDIPHVAWADLITNMGTDYSTVYYTNRVGGSWNTAVEIRGATASVNASIPVIAIDSENIPFIALQDGASTRAFIGNANDASSFTSFTSTTNGSEDVSVAIDSSGNHYLVSQLTSPSNLRIHKHNYGDAWSTWQTAQTIVSSTTNPSVSLAIDGTDLYVFVEDGSSNDIGYYKSTNYTAWDSLVTLETGTYNTVRAKWAFWVDNDSAGPLAEANPGPRISGDSINGGTGTDEKQAQTFQLSRAGDVNTVSLQLTQNGTVTDNISLSIRTSQDGTSLASDTIAGSSVPSGGGWVSFDMGGVSLSASTTYYLQLERSGSRDTVNRILWWRTSSSSTYANGTASTKASGSWSDNAYDNLFIIKLNATEIDYVFTDETATPDILWNTISLAAPEPTTHGEGYFIITS